MIKLPEPFRKQGQQLCNDGNTTVFFDAYNKDQLKQAVRDALNLAADTCETTLYVEGDGAVSAFGPKTDANVEIRKCHDAIRALIKEIPE